MKKELGDVLLFTFIVLLITTFSAISNSMVYGNKYGGNMTFIMSIYPIVSAILVEKGFNIKTIAKDKLSATYLIYFSIIFILSLLSLKYEVFMDVFRFIIPSTALLSLYILAINNKVLVGNFSFKELFKWIIVILVILNVQLGASNYYMTNDIYVEDLMTRSVFSITTGLISNICFIFFTIGEEYAWRYFLQAKLQKISGKRVGVLLTGLIWGLFHVPIYGFLFYSGLEGIYACVNIVIFCIAMGVFLGLIYMRSKSVIMVSLIHSLNNMYKASGIVSTQTATPDAAAISQFFIFSAVMSLVLFLPFLLAKEYAKK